MGFCVEFVKNIDLFTVSTNLSTQIVDNSGACTHTPAEHNGCTQTEKNACIYMLPLYHQTENISTTKRRGMSIAVHYH